MAIRRPEIIDFATSLGSSPDIDPTTGSNRFYLVVDISETNAQGVMTAATIGGVDARIIYQLSNATMNFYAYCLDEAGIQAMSGTGITRTGASLAASFITTGVVFQYVDQIEPFIDALNDGYSGFTANGTGTAPYTLDEIVDGLGVVIGGNSKTTGTWTYNNGYTEYVAPATDGSNMAAVIATKATDAVAADVLTNLVNSLPSDKTCCFALMLRPGDDGASPPPEDPGSPLNLALMESLEPIQFHLGASGETMTNQSDVVWSESMQLWLAVSNSTGSLIKYNEAGAYQGIITKSGNSTNDIEGLCHLVGDTYLLANENNQVWKAVVDATTTNIDLQSGSNQSYTGPPRGLSNKGFEGAVVDKVNNICWVVQESDPMRVLNFVIPADKVDLTPYEHGVDITFNEPFDAEALYSGIIQDLASIEIHPETGNLILLSERSQLVLVVEPVNGGILERLPLPDHTQPEGLHLKKDANGNYFLKIWGEPNESQRWQVVVIGGPIILDAVADISTGSHKEVNASISISAIADSSLTAEGIKVASGGASLSAVASIGCNGFKQTDGNVSISSVADSVATGSKTSNGTVSLSAISNSTLSGEKRVNGSASLDAVADIVVTGNGTGEAQSNVELVAIADIAVAGFKVASGGASLSAVADIANQGNKTVSGNVTVSAVADINIVATKQNAETRNGTASLNAVATTTIQGFKTGLGNTSINGVSDITNSGLKESSGFIELSAVSDLVVSGSSVIMADLDPENLFIESANQYFRIDSCSNYFQIH